MRVIQEYHQKFVSAEKAVGIVKSGDWIDYGFALGQPQILDRALAARKAELVDVNIRGGVRMTPLKVVECDPQRTHFCYNSWHFGALERRLSDKGLCSCIPILYRNMPFYYRKSLTVDVLMLAVTPMDEQGFFNFSLTNSASRASVEAAKVVIVEINENLPRIGRGKSCGVHISEVDFIVEGDHPALATIPEGNISAEDKKIAAIIMDQIPNGATIQLGIGALPNAVGNMIAESDLRDLGMHTEMVVDAFRIIDQAGKLTNRLKSINQGESVFCIGFGSAALYDWVRENERLASYPVDYVNDPAVIAQQDNMIAINNCLEVDLYGQVASESIGSRQISGTGGQVDFMTGSYMAKGGKGFITLTSTYVDKKSGKIKSRLVPSLKENTIVSNLRAQAHYIVTEWGMADIAGRTAWERAERLIAVAHPSFHEELIRQAEQLGIWRQSQKRP